MEEFLIHFFFGEIKASSVGGAGPERKKERVIRHMDWVKIASLGLMHPSYIKILEIGVFVLFRILLLTA